MTEKEKAIESLEKQLILITDNSVHQTQLNITTDYLRKFLGEKSKIYDSFSKIDISISDGLLPQRINNAQRLLEAAISFIQVNGIDQDFESKILKLQYKELKYKTIFSIVGFLLGALFTFSLTHAKAIYTLMTQARP